MSSKTVPCVWYCNLFMDELKCRHLTFSVALTYLLYSSIYVQTLIFNSVSDSLNTVRITSLAASKNKQLPGRDPLSQRLSHENFVPAPFPMCTGGESKRTASRLHQNRTTRCQVSEEPSRSYSVSISLRGDACEEKGLQSLMIKSARIGMYTVAKTYGFSKIQQTKRYL